MPYSTRGLEDFSSARILTPLYLGSDEKLTVEMDGARWMLKFGSEIASDSTKPLLGSYNNSPISEFVACHIAQALGIRAQDTRLGTYDGRLVVACKDFCADAAIPTQLIEFARLENGTKGSSSANRRTPEFGFTMKVLNESPYLEPIRTDAVQGFWEMFCFDALVGNHDRHASNWGYLYDDACGSLYDCAPIYDCASALCPMLDEDQMPAIMNSMETHRNRVLGRPRARLIVDGDRVRYRDFLLSDNGAAARQAAARIAAAYDADDISRVIEATPAASEVYKEFMGSEVAFRERLIIEPAREMALLEQRGEIDRPER